jgi:hypothetical protein
LPDAVAQNVSQQCDFAVCPFVRAIAKIFADFYWRKDFRFQPLF